MEDQEQPSQAQEDQLNSQAEEGQNYSRPVITNDPSCEHDYIDIGTDAEGKGMAACRKCPIGRYFDRNTKEVINGKIKEKK